MGEEPRWPEPAAERRSLSLGSAMEDELYLVLPAVLQVL
jgi:hypothetical protein